MSTAVSSASETTGSVTPSLQHKCLNSTYNLGKKLGSGCFAKVYKATRRVDGAVFAIKVVDKARLDAETACLLQNELEVLCAVSKHPGIVTLIESVETEAHMYFVMDYVDGGPLLDRIVERGSFSENDARKILRTTLQTLVFLADLGCVHRDIKPENILVDNYSTVWPVKLTDFGLSAKMQPDTLLYGTLGTPLFLAPEILRKQGYDSACDMWSLGVVLYLVLCGYPPFPYDTPSVLITAIIRAEVSFPAPEWDHVSEDAKDALRGMMEADPKKRITPRKALEHPWFRVEQSTTDLPNSQLKSFNARRKFKAFSLAIKLMNYLKPSRDISLSALSQEQLVQDVENNRAVIQALAITEASSSNVPDAVRESARSVDEKGNIKVVRRSLVLPSGILENMPDDDATSMEGETTRENMKKHPLLSDSGPWNSLVMQSRAKALVAEAKGSAATPENANPFLRPITFAEQTTEMGGGQKLCRLNLSGLGFM